MYYAQIDENNICAAVSKVKGEIKKDNMIEIDFYDTSLLGKKYNNGVWEEVPEEEPEISEQDIFQAQTLLNQAEIITKQADMDETLAAILLNQTEV